MSWCRLVYRDIKSANIGFDVRGGDIKIFDFWPLRRITHHTRHIHRYTRNRTTLQTNLPYVPDHDPTWLPKSCLAISKTPKPVVSHFLGYFYMKYISHVYFDLVVNSSYPLKLPCKEITALDYKIKIFRTTNYRPKLGKLWPTLMKSLLVECWDTHTKLRID